MVSMQERFLIKSGLLWRWYGNLFGEENSANSLLKKVADENLHFQKIYIFRGTHVFSSNYDVCFFSSATLFFWRQCADFFYPKIFFKYKYECRKKYQIWYYKDQYRSYAGFNLILKTSKYVHTCLVTSLNLIHWPRLATGLKLDLDLPQILKVKIYFAMMCLWEKKNNSYIGIF